MQPAAAAEAPPPGDLPPPASGLFLEVSFRRLLASCEDIASGASTARPDLASCWQRSPVFHHYVETLQEQLADLETAAGARLPRTTLTRYAAAVETLASRLQRADVPAFCAGVSPQPAAAAALQQQPGPPAGHLRSQPAAAAAAPPAVPRPVVLPPPVPVARTPQLQQPLAKPAEPAARPRQEAAGAAAAGQAAGPPTAAAPAAGGTQQSAGTAGGRLHTQQQLHEDLTEELAGLAAQLKSNTLAIEGRLKERGQLLDSTEAALDTSVQRTRESKERATQVHRRGRVNFCLTCLVMLIVGLAFAGKRPWLGCPAMYMFIKLTRLAGYRAPVPVPAAAPVPAAVETMAPGGIPVYEEHYAEL